MPTTRRIHPFRYRPELEICPFCGKPRAGPGPCLWSGVGSDIGPVHEADAPWTTAYYRPMPHMYAITYWDRLKNAMRVDHVRTWTAADAWFQFEKDMKLEGRR
jgi:hypothetical protein